MRERYSRERVPSSQACTERSSRGPVQRMSQIFPSPRNQAVVSCPLGTRGLNFSRKSGAATDTCPVAGGCAQDVGQQKVVSKGAPAMLLPPAAISRQDSRI